MCSPRWALPCELRDSQRTYFCGQLDRLFPGLRPRYEQHYGQAYHAQARNANQLYALVNSLCAQHGLAQRIKPYQDGPDVRQMTLF